MSASHDKNLARYYPWDMLTLLCSPFIIAVPTMLFSWVPFLDVAEKTFVFCVAAIIALVGTAFIAWAKWPLYQAGIYFSFGSSAISETLRAYYYWGMGLVVVGCLLLMALAF